MAGFAPCRSARSPRARSDVPVRGDARPGGVADNAFQGSTLTTAFEWNAAPSSAPPTPTPTPDPATPVPPPCRIGPATGSLDPRHRGPRARVLERSDPTGACSARSVPAARLESCLSRRKLTIHDAAAEGLRSGAKITVNRKTRVKLKGLKARKIKSRRSACAACPRARSW